MFNLSIFVCSTHIRLDEWNKTENQNHIQYVSSIRTCIYIFLRCLCKSKSLCILNLFVCYPRWQIQNCWDSKSLAYWPGNLKIWLKKLSVLLLFNRWDQAYAVTKSFFFFFLLMKPLSKALIQNHWSVLLVISFTIIFQVRLIPVQHYCYTPHTGSFDVFILNHLLNRGYVGIYYCIFPWV